MSFFIESKRDKATLIRIIIKELEIGLIISNDGRRAYSVLKKDGYNDHGTVNHQTLLADLISQTRSLAIKGLQRILITRIL